MPDPTAKDVADKLRATHFGRGASEPVTLTDPIADTPMVVTLDQLQPYDLNPRVTRNPRYDEIKASIRERGLEATPTITRRPGEVQFIVRNGGNTRLAILRELWGETKDERFFRIPCLFRPWTTRGEIVALTGHLAENELRGGLSFIERALGVEKARELYEREIGEPLTQSELARRLSSDGYPITQPHISRMQEAVRYLLPAIPTVLYGGLGKPQIERLTALRRVALRIWERSASQQPRQPDFESLFQDVLASFDHATATFNVQRVQDELIGQLATLLETDYDALALEFVDADLRQRSWSRESPVPPEAMFHVKPNTGEADRHSLFAPSGKSNVPMSGASLSPRPSHSDPPSSSRPHISTAIPPRQRDRATGPSQDKHFEGHIVSAVQSTDRLQAIQRTIAEATGDPVSDFETNVVHAIPVQAGGLHPISDVWFIEPALDVPDRLRVHAAQLAREIAQEADLAHRVETVDAGIGFVCARVPVRSKDQAPAILERAILSLLHALSAAYVPTHRSGIDAVRLADDLGVLLQGQWSLRTNPRTAARSAAARLSDAGIVKLFRLIRLARRIVELESGRPTDGSSSDDR